jgi:MOSC domain-containing protein YiiM
MSKPVVISVNMSSGGIPKLPVESAQIARSGLLGDAHNHAKHNTLLQAVSIIDVEDLDDLCREGFDVYSGATGENLTARDLNVDALSVGDRLAFAGGVEVELTRARQPCFVLDSIDPQLKKAILGRCGFLAKVIREGEIRTGEAIEVIRASSPCPAASAST